MNAALKSRRHNLGLSIGQAAQVAGLPQATWWNAETDAVEPHPSTKLKIAQAVHCNVVDLWPIVDQRTTDAA